MSGSIHLQHTVFALDCPDAADLAQFYATLLGWQVADHEAEADWVDVRPPGEDLGFHIACQQIEDYRAPEWPQGNIPQQGHLDFYVDSISDSEQLVFDAGGTRHTHQPSDAEGFVVYLDPAGHPFCLCES
jgi:catechol 2,3-dioxygenase-like lactoylglutathione lyase family enzyme